MKKYNPILAVYLNLIIPGLGCAYLKKWKYAIAFFFWTPLRLIVGAIAIDLVYDTFKPAIGPWMALVLYLVLAFMLWAFILWDTVSTPYRLALEKIEKAQQSQEA